MVPASDTALITLGAEYGTVPLRYPLGAMRRLARHLKCNDSLESLHEVLSQLNGSTLSAFIWAGMLHLEEWRELPFAKVHEHVEWLCMPYPSMYKPVNEALLYAAQGEPDGEQAKADKGKAASHGRGRAPSGSRRSLVSRLLPSGILRWLSSPATSGAQASSSSGTARSLRPRRLNS